MTLKAVLLSTLIISLVIFFELYFHSIAPLMLWLSNNDPAITHFDRLDRIYFSFMLSMISMILSGTILLFSNLNRINSEKTS